jgi:biopolymer transport protein ExbB
MKKSFIKICLGFVAASLICTSAFAVQGDTPAASLDELLKLIKNEKIGETKVYREREARFKKEKSNQQRLLNKAIATRKAEERRSDILDKQFASNERLLDDLQTQLDERLGSLKELFGHLSAAAGDVVATLNQSLVSSQYPDRGTALVELIKKTSGSTTTLPNVIEIEGMWLAIMNEMSEGSRVVRFMAPVVSTSGDTNEQEIVRIGTYNLLSEGEYLDYSRETGVISALARQPARKYTQSAEALDKAGVGFTPVGIDPTGADGGGLLNALVGLPTITEKWHEGGLVGYIISAVGGVAVLLALWRFVILASISSKVKAQLKNSQPNENNPLGRVLSVAASNPNIDAESLELKMHEAVLKERPPIEFGLNLLKIIAMIAPLLGLLGTVTGMIVTFQGIMLFGAGDPKNMAGGISQALVTTVLGLIVAIPTVLLHTFVNGRAQRILHILEEQSAGIVAENVEG